MNEQYINININKCLSKAKQDILISLIIAMIITILTYIQFRRTNDPFFMEALFFELVAIIGFGTIFILKYYCVKKIKVSLIKNKYASECEHVIYWCKDNFLLTANCFCLVSKRKVYIVPYSDIQSIKVEEHTQAEGFALILNTTRFLYIKTNNGQSFKVQMCDSWSKNNEGVLEDFSFILLNKNKNIIVEPPNMST